jgi:formate-dependent nitrite reductase membrane component NrfD
MISDEGSTDLGGLSGEAASDATLARKHDIALHSQAFPYVPSQQSRSSPTYYDRPMLKEPVWRWSIPAYFYLGGVTGATATLGAAAQIIAPRSMRSLIIRSRWLAVGGSAISAALLIHDLGRPARFFHMLRVFRITSPMSMGSWILIAFSSAASAAAILPFGPRFLHPLADLFGVVIGVLGLGMAGYTGVLISQTAVPIWRESYRTSPVLFLASGSAAAGSFLDLFSMSPREAKSVERFGIIGKLLQLGAALALEAEACRIQRVGQPLREGFGGFLWQSAKVLTIASVIVSVMQGNSRRKRVAAGLLGSAASICLRFGIFYAGKASARDPRASFEQQRI